MNIAIQATNLTIEQANKTLCREFSLNVMQGDIVGILGANGCGKTTLLQTLAGFRSSPSGSIHIHEKILSSYSVKALARVRGMLFQEFHLGLPMSVYDYCAASRYPHHRFLGKLNDGDHRIILSALEKMELANLQSQSVGSLSGGEKKRLAMAALFIQSPSIYFLDEPTNHLDVKHQLQTLNHFRKLSHETNASVVMSLHDVNIAQAYCNHIVLMFDDGNYLQGNPCDILTSEHLSRLYGCDMQPLFADNTIWWRASA